MNRPIVFLHIPKTAGQTIHNELARIVGGVEYVSPVRVHTQAPSRDQLPPGYLLYSGHIDWTSLNSLRVNPFVFSVIRDPRERIASFYLYLLKEAKKLSESKLLLPENIGKRKILEYTADEYFFSGESSWHSFILDHYDNFYMYYFATKLMRGRSTVSNENSKDVLMMAVRSLNHLDGIYITDQLERLELDILENFQKEIQVKSNFYNVGPHSQGDKRWPSLTGMFEKDSSVARLEEFTAYDQEIFEYIKLRNIR